LAGAATYSGLMLMTPVPPVAPPPKLPLELPNRSL